MPRTEPLRRPAPGRRHGLGPLAAATAVLLAAGCGAASEPSDVATPLPDPPDATAVGPTLADASAPSADTTAPTERGEHERDRELTTVATVLDAYGRVLDEIAADPAGAPPPGTAGLARWHAVVVADSALSAEVLGRVHQRATLDRVVVTPGAAGVSYRHRATALRRTSPDAIEFDWCGWSPGIGRSLDSGAVVDDRVAHSSGTGRIVLLGDGWRLERLDELDLELLAPGAEDPCPTAPSGAVP